MLVRLFSTRDVLSFVWETSERIGQSAKLPKRSIHLLNYRWALDYAGYSGARLGEKVAPTAHNIAGVPDRTGNGRKHSKKPKAKIPHLYG